MGYEYICPICKAHLDPGEKCDCAKENQKSETVRVKNYYQKGEQKHARRAIYL